MMKQIHCLANLRCEHNIKVELTEIGVRQKSGFYLAQRRAVVMTNKTAGSVKGGI